MFYKIKQNAMTIIEISYIYDNLLKNEKKNKKKIKTIEKIIYALVLDTKNELKEVNGLKEEFLP